MIRPEVTSFIAQGPLPASLEAEEAHLQRLDDALRRITSPVTREEAVQLATAFGPDDCFGLAWSLVHLIESATGGPPLDAIPPSTNEWIVRLREWTARSTRK